ncbi:YibE/F family protein [Naumannella sp. ID2617S]|uniref:YibE/F family protein n=1 Tax=Enemella dayhoffiae TaxID=2016507 RepID=A0A255HBZ2_9ACTN|nr:YibE/F family protein [Enemella dayhoffiae]NNG19970.1 YibE/F family protein [Naumannella sp. ID2617S]OYO25195.1 YibE/F family protein [Enemella dayhoffiae]
MSHTHTSTPASRSPEDLARQRRALRLMIIALIPIAVWTLGALIVMWPTNVKAHLTEGISTYSVQGLSIETGRMIEVAEINCEGTTGSTPTGPAQSCGKARVEMLTGPEKGQIIDEVTLKASDFSSGAEAGQKVRLFRVPMEGMPAQYQFNDFERSTPMLVFTALFALAVVAVARLRGLLSLIGLGFAAFILVKFMFPALVVGSNPILVGLVGGSAIMFVVLYTAHGFSARTTTALLGTLFGLFAAAGLGYVATKWAHFTGVTSEDDFVLQAAAPDLKLTSVVICGIMVAGLGVLNDVTITQASAVWELAEADPDGPRLFRRAMRIGRDHIASTVYTIAFATAGATLGTMLLLSIYQRPLFEVIQTETFAQEIMRTVVGSIGLVLAVPLTTAIGVAVVSASKKSRGEISLATDGPTAGPGDELVDKDRYRS